MMRTEAFFISLLTTALLTACDPGEPVDSDLHDAELAPLDEPTPAATPAPVGGLAAEPDVIEDQACSTYYFTTSQNDTKKSECTLSGPEDLYPVLNPWWDDRLYNELGGLASATCASEGARNGAGQLPGLPGGGAPAGDDIDQLVAPGTSASSDEIDDFSDGVDGATPILGMPIAQATCQTVCQGYGKVWDYTSANFGTCAFNKVVAVQAPEHEVGGAACTGPNTQRWTLNGGVLFDCGCRCV
ncbi:MAG: hypothetical protein H6712_00545 [Myxococcales bacterium]|nr:hypothetical protein [Myxococcales bacterium]MCB9712313.1 hypothetical protein [Myxococcales bacterium]